MSARGIQRIPPGSRPTKFWSRSGLKSAGMAGSVAATTTMPRSEAANWRQ